MDLKTFQAVLPAAALSLLVACGGSSSSPVETGPLTLSVTDLPVDSTTIERVCVDFNRITVHYAGQADVVLDYDPLPSQVRQCSSTLVRSAYGIIRREQVGG